jgi:hypothetical protein
MTTETADSTAFSDLLESRLRDLTATLSDSSIDDLEAELTDLVEILNSYRRNDELLEGLLDPRTRADQREQIQEALRAQHILVARNREEVERTHAKSHQVLERSALLLARIDRQIYLTTHAGGGYAPEICGFCKGLGGTYSKNCLACNGKRTVLVHQPPRACTRCNGRGKPEPHDRSQFFSDFCIICRGTGWALISRSSIL